MNQFNIKGTGVAIITPFDKQGNVDFPALSKLINHIIDGGVDYIVCLGTTSEYPTLTEKEQLAVKDFTIEAVDKRVPIVIGLGGNNTRELVAKISKYNFDGISAILSVSPYYNKPTQKGLYNQNKL